MKVILLKDVKKVGQKYEVKDVSAGYALNFLIPNKFAEAATSSSLSRLDSSKAKADAEKKIQEDLLVKNIKSLEGVGIELKEPANDKGSLFKGIHKEEIAAAIKKQTQLDITPEYITLDKPIKEVGEHTLEVKVQDKIATFKVTVAAK
jgi:large subunit ribosomal protein L9